jgi:hypothetical protein
MVDTAELSNSRGFSAFKIEYIGEAGVKTAAWIFAKQHPEPKEENASIDEPIRQAE